MSIKILITVESVIMINILTIEASASQVIYISRKHYCLEQKNLKRIFYKLSVLCFRLFLDHSFIAERQRNNKFKIATSIFTPMPTYYSLYGILSLNIGLFCLLFIQNGG